MTPVLVSLLAVLLTALGGLVVVAGERDDSPGLSGIGLLLVVVAVALVVRRARGRRT